MTDPRHQGPYDPIDPNGAPRSPYTDPGAEPRPINTTVVRSGSNGGLIAAGVIAVLLVISLIYFASGPATDPGTTATIPDAGVTEEGAPAGTNVAPTDETAPAEQAPAEQPAAPAEGGSETAPAEAPAANQ